MTLPHHLTRAARVITALAALCLSLCVSQGTAPSGVLAQAKKDQGATRAGAKSASQSGEVIVILASEAEGKIDAELKRLEALQKPPFNGFKSMKVVSKQKLSLSTERPVTAELPNGRRMQIEMLEVAKDGRYKVRVAINKPKAKDYLPGMVVAASAGEPFFVAGQKHKGGTLVIGIRVGTKGGKSKP